MCGKLTQKEYETRNDWVMKLIHCELCKKLKFDHTNKWYMHKLEYVSENEMYKNSLRFWDTNRSPNPDQKTRHSDNQQKRKMTD